MFLLNLNELGMSKKLTLLRILFVAYWDVKKDDTFEIANWDVQERKCGILVTKG